MSPVDDTWLTVWTPLPLGAYAKRGQGSLEFPLREPGCRLFRMGRQALWHGLRAIGLRPGDEALVPAYHHGAEVEVLERAGVGCRFYEATESLEPDEEELAGLLGPRVRALHLIHYLGFPLDAPRWRRWCDERGLLLIEDVAMGWPAHLDGRPLGAWGDMAIWSPWKTLGLPDGGALLCGSPPPPVPPGSALAPARLLRSHAAWLAQRWRWAATPARRRRSKEAPFDAAAAFALGDPDAPIGRTSAFLLRRLPAREAAAARLANYRRLLEGLRERVPSPFDDPPDGACPFAMPLETDRKEALLDRLRRFGVGGLDVWSVPHPTLPTGRFPKAAHRRATTVGLPVHQELRPADLDRIATAAAG